GLHPASPDALRDLHHRDTRLAQVSRLSGLLVGGGGDVLHVGQLFGEALRPADPRPARLAEVVRVRVVPAELPARTGDALFSHQVSTIQRLGKEERAGEPSRAAEEALEGWRV